MPLFGRKHRDNATSNAGHESTDAAGYNNDPNVIGSGGNRLRKNQGPHNDSAYPPQNARDAGGYGGQQGGYNPPDNDPFANDDGYYQAGYGGPGGAARHGMTPQTDIKGNPAQPRGGGGSRFTGKVESAVGSMLGSENLKRKGMEKEQESQALKVQAAELSEAERLEQEALARRQRAVAHGAHPDHKHLGSHNPGAGPTNVNEFSGGANTGAGGVGGVGSGARGGY